MDTPPPSRCKHGGRTEPSAIADGHRRVPHRGTRICGRLVITQSFWIFRFQCSRVREYARSRSPSTGISAPEQGCSELLPEVHPGQPGLVSVRDPTRPVDRMPSAATGCIPPPSLRPTGPSKARFRGAATCRRRKSRLPFHRSASRRPERHNVPRSPGPNHLESIPLSSARRERSTEAAARSSEPSGSVEPAGCRLS
jgi:hypothetical protein